MKTSYFLFVFLLLLCPASVAGAAPRPFSEADLRNLTVEFPDSVLSILDQVEEGKAAAELQPYQISLLRGLAYNEKRMFSMVERYARETLANDSTAAHDRVKLNALTLLSTAQAYFGDYQGSIATSTEAIALAREMNNPTAEFNVLTQMAKTSFEMGNRKQGYLYLDQIISGGEKAEDARTLANVSAAYGVKVVELYTDDRFADGIAEGKKRLAIIEKIDKVGGAPAGFTDQQRAYTYARLASCSEQAGEKRQAADAYAAFMATDYAKSPVGKAYIMDYLLTAGKWREVLGVTQGLRPILSQGDTINGDYQSLLQSEAQAYAGLGDYRRAYGLTNRANAIGDSLNMRENTLRAAELAEVFALNEKELELVNVKASLQRKHVVMIGAIVAAVLVCIILILLWRAYRVSRREQILATQRIDDLLASNKVKYDKAKEAMESEDAELRQFMEMQRLIMDNELFKQANFNRESIMQACGLPRTKVVNLIDRFTGLTPNDYINRLRIEYSVKLIQEHPEWTIDAIAEECGYGRRGTYYSHFNKVFGITPAQYRKEKLKQTKDA